MPERVVFSGLNDPALYLAVASGLIYCFLGYRFLKISIALVGFALAGSCAAVLAGIIAEENQIVMIISAVIGGIAGVFALLFMFKIGIFCLGVLGGYVCAQTVMENINQPWTFWAILGIALAGGIFALLIERPVLKLATAAIGSTILLHCSVFVMKSFDIHIKDNHKWIVLIAWFVITSVGMVVQLRTPGKQKKIVPANQPL